MENNLIIDFSKLGKNARRFSKDFFKDVPAFDPITGLGKIKLKDKTEIVFVKNANGEQRTYAYAKRKGFAGGKFAFVGCSEIDKKNDITLYLGKDNKTKISNKEKGSIKIDDNDWKNGTDSEEFKVAAALLNPTEHVQFKSTSKDEEVWQIVNGKIQELQGELDEIDQELQSLDSYNNENIKENPKEEEKKMDKELNLKDKAKIARLKKERLHGLQDKDGIVKRLVNEIDSVILEYCGTVSKPITNAEKQAKFIVDQVMKSLSSTYSNKIAANKEKIENNLIKYAKSCIEELTKPEPVKVEVVKDMDYLKSRIKERLSADSNKSLAFVLKKDSEKGKSYTLPKGKNEYTLDLGKFAEKTKVDLLNAKGEKTGKAIFGGVGYIEEDQNGARKNIVSFKDIKEIKHIDYKAGLAESFANATVDFVLQRTGAEVSKEELEELYKFAQDTIYDNVFTLDEKQTISDIQEIQISFKNPKWTLRNEVKDIINSVVNKKTYEDRVVLADDLAEEFFAEHEEELKEYSKGKEDKDIKRNWRDFFLVVAQDINYVTPLAKPQDLNDLKNFERQYEEDEYNAVVTGAVDQTYNKIVDIGDFRNNSEVLTKQEEIEEQVEKESEKKAHPILKALGIGAATLVLAAACVALGRCACAPSAQYSVSPDHTSGQTVDEIEAAQRIENAIDAKNLAVDGYIYDAIEELNGDYTNGTAYAFGQNAEGQNDYLYTIKYDSKNEDVLNAIENGTVTRAEEISHYLGEDVNPAVTNKLAKKIDGVSGQLFVNDIQSTGKTDNQGLSSYQGKGQIVVSDNNGVCGIGIVTGRDSYSTNTKSAASMTFGYTSLGHTDGKIQVTDATTETATVSMNYNPKDIYPTKELGE